MNTHLGQIHYVVEGEGDTVILLHQTPRSIDEYKEVIPILARTKRVIAMDTIGYGDSDKPPRECTIQDYAQTVVQLLNYLEIEKANIVGHHTGAFIAIEVAIAHSDRVDKLVLSPSSYMDEQERRRRKYGAIFEQWRISSNGSHCAYWWNYWKKMFPDLSPQLLHRINLDVLKAGETSEYGHWACSKYRMEERLPLVECPTLVIHGTRDIFTTMKNKRMVARKIRNAKELFIEGGTFFLPTEFPEKFAEAIEEFLDTPRVS